ncbi:transmembrane protein, putative (macronuclear) [Tetrahymena thermophila SB210]|uniref:Transmembrane protein, putative n=1 Tax=Tetrahymena thermophila (strain SB210) TaxID=312017 RepID=W7XGY2_TETTS|nr:transmembrane protein, putative [Tetrahymena thermophila SB210]EWS72264.1 transmembrane protein, putative [Tetrahymena thermophila SB210]|eukprot:XP_012655204.1 transmembrane protein, putative [Tetrahymena thermophila SB210]
MIYTRARIKTLNEHSKEYCVRKCDGLLEVNQKIYTKNKNNTYNFYIQEYYQVYYQIITFNGYLLIIFYLLVMRFMGSDR